MTPGTFLRHRAPVQALHIVPPGQQTTGHDATLTDAADWLREHEVRSMVVLDDDGSGFLIAHAGSTRLPLRVGQWLVRDVNLGDFTVCDDFDFRCLHGRVGA